MVRGPWQTIQPARRAWKVWKTWGWKQSEHAATRVASEGISWSMERASVRPDIWSREATPGYPVRADGPLMHQWRLLRKSERLVRASSEFANSILTAPARAQLLAQGPIRRRPLRLRQSQCLQGQADVVRRVATVQDPLGPLRVQSRTPDDPIQPVPDPGRPVRDERHGLGLRGTQAMEVEGQQFHQVVRPVHRAVDPRPRPPDHPPFAVAEIEDQEFGLAPLDADLAAVLHAPTFLALDRRADADSPSIHLGDDVLSNHLLTRRELTVSVALQVAGPCRQDLGPQLAGHAVGPPSRRASAPGGGVHRGPTRSRGARRSDGRPG